MIEDRQSLLDDVVALAVLDVDHESDTAGIVLVPGIIEPVGRRQSKL
jgi:hypothetical protein